MANLFDIQLPNTTQQLDPFGSALGVYDQKQPQAPVPFTSMESYAQSRKSTGAKYISKNEIKSILDKAPDNNVRSEVISALAQQGYQIEGLNDVQTVDQTSYDYTPTQEGIAAYKPVLEEQIKQQERIKAGEETRKQREGARQIATNVFGETIGGAVSTAGESIGDIIGGVVTRAPETISNIAQTANTVGGYINPLTTSEDTARTNEFLKGIGSNVSKGLESAATYSGTYDPSTKSAEVGRVGADIAASSMIPGGVLGKGYKAASTLSKVGRGAAQGAIETGKFTAASEGRLPTAQEMAVGGVIGGVLPIAGKLASKATTFVTEKVPENLIAIGLGTPSQLMKTSERLNRLGIKEYSEPNAVSKWLLNKKVTGEIEDRITQLEKIAQDSSYQAKNLLKTSKTSIPVNNSAVRTLKNGMESIIQDVENAGLMKEANKIRKTFSKPALTLEDINYMRTFLADKAKIFSKSGEMVDSLKKEGLQKAWLNASKLLEAKAPGFRALNKDTEVAIALADAARLKVGQEQARSLFSLGNVAKIGAGAGIGAGVSEDNIKGTVGGIAATSFLALLASPKNVSKLAVLLARKTNKSPGVIEKALNSFYESRGSTKLPDYIYNSIDEIVKKIKK